MRLVVDLFYIYVSLNSFNRLISYSTAKVEVGNRVRSTSL